MEYVQSFGEPILFLVFNRLNVTIRVFEEIKKIKPIKLYIAADGYRKNKPGEEEMCLAVRKFVLENVDWECDVNTLFRDENLGCKNAVSSALNWFFENEERGIILEDDCLPSLSFFYFCSELLEKHKSNSKIMAITGYNGIDPHYLNYTESYHYSIYFHCWGWATWRRVWNEYDKDMLSWKKFRKEGRLRSVDRSRLFKLYWTGVYDDVYDGKINTWDCQMGFLIWKSGGVCCTPRKNLVTNIGFGANATHTTDENLPEIERFELELPLIHPAFVNRNTAMDKLENKYVYNIKLLPIVLAEIRKTLLWHMFRKTVFLTTKAWR